jgi:hypothetical protein
MEDRYKISKPGTNFDAETGKLYVFRSGSITVMKAWPPMAWKKTRSHPTWSHCRPEISIPCRDIEGRIRRLETPADANGQLLLPFCLPPEEEKAHRAEVAWLRWYATIPTEIRELVRHFQKRQWHMLSFLARCGEAAYDLTVSNPALAYALASNWVYHRPPVQRPMRSARALLRRGRKQRDILAWLGFPGTEAARKALTKVIHKAISVCSLLYIRQSMADFAMAKAISHLQRLNAGAIRIATDPELLPLAAPTLIEEVSTRRDEDQRPKAAYMLQDSLNMFRLLFPNGRSLQPVRRFSYLAELHDSLVDDLNRTRISNMDVLFPPPPVEGTETIVPITNARELVEEGRAQHNCVASYVERVAVRRQVYIYRVLWPERCTLSLRRCGNTWVLSELKRACNERPSEVTRRVIEKWLIHEARENMNEPLARELEEVPF